MNFLGIFWWVEDIINEIMTAIDSGIHSLFYLLNTHVYKLIAWLYDMFETLCKSRLLNSEIIQSLADRISIILGIVMLFMVTISCIQMLIEPDTVSDKEKGAGNIIKKVIIVIILLGTGSFVFDTLYEVQKALIENHVISKLLLPYEINDENFGGVISSELFVSFYHIDYNFKDDNGNITEVNTVGNCVDAEEILKTQISHNNNFDSGYNCLNTMVSSPTDPNSKMRVMEFNFLIMLVCGIFVAYVFFQYCITVGIRTIQLAFLEIISPMAFISYLSPKKDTMLEKWWKIYFATYIDVFIRIMLINFILFLVATIFSNDQSWEFFKSIGNVSGGSLLFIKVVMVLALLTFAKKAPDLLKDLFPTGAAKLGFGADNAFGAGLLGLGIGAVGGAVGGAMAGGSIAGRLSGAATGLFRGGKAGMSAKKPFDLKKSLQSGYSNSRAATLRNEQRIAAGGSRNPFTRIGAQARANKYDKAKTNLETENAAYNNFAGYYDAAKKRAEGKILDGKLTGISENADNALAAKRKMEILQAQAGNMDKNLYIEDITDENGNISKRFNEQRYQDDLNSILSEINVQQKTYNDSMKEATKDYFTKAIETAGTEDSFDDVIMQNITMAQGVIDNNSDYEVFKDVNITDYSTFDKINNEAKSHVTGNTIELAKNAQEGKQARANAKYSGSKQ